MIKTLALALTLLASSLGIAQEETENGQPNVTVKWAPTGLLLGSASLQAEYNFGGRNSLTAKIGLPVSVKHSLPYDNNDVVFDMKAASFLAGYRTYFSPTHLRGLYYEPFFKYVYHTSEGEGQGTLNGRTALFSFTNNYSGASVGVQLGAQFFIGKRLVIDWFFLGPEINSASNTLKVAEVSSSIPWTFIDAEKAENQVKEFVDQFPFIRNRTTIVVDKEVKRVTAAFKGALPGVRTGVSIGFAF